MIKSPLRYPGGKSKAIKQIVEYLPESFAEFREPFVGGGSVFIYLKQKFPNLKIWINDLNPELYLFWKVAQSDISKLVSEVIQIKNNCKDGKFLFRELTNLDVNKLTDSERAVRFFVLNRITFSGTVESGGFSQQAFYKRFTDSSIQRLEKLGDILSENVQITNLDYSHLLYPEGEDVFIFLDPPYLRATSSRLYGKNGNLHTSFEHQKFAELLKQCHHNWLITYDNSPQIRENFQSVNLAEWEMQYGMNNYKQSGAAKGKELFISNYQVEENLDKNLTISEFPIQLCS
ncbi:DNA adenine methylase [Cylindrospermum sp. FACHB-282]|uniref:DNA adenine methylase n=1 Tax=Cylindrospermum sp. FACHB-282 TaxID=2692794 RepID=UPI0016826A3A|nr:DNA adenine methylase [Cylindrospermum sp. FACHB-282]MBD2387933.1 DNA adenine methylase [Cylindrospermum sp. FACHB-282]